jgi:hypothetical protein
MGQMPKHILNSKKSLTCVPVVGGNEKVCTGRDLAKALDYQADLPSREAKAWHRDLQAARRILKEPKNRWL